MRRISPFLCHALPSSILILSLAVLTAGKQVNATEVALSDEAQVIELNREPTRGIISRTGDLLAVAQLFGQVYSIYDLPSGRHVATYRQSGPAGTNNQLGFDQQDRLYIPGINAAFASGLETPQSAITVVDTKQGFEHTIKPDQGSSESNGLIKSVVVSRNTDTLAALTSRGRIVVYSLRENRTKSVYETTNAQPALMALSPNGKLLVLGYENGKVELRDTNSGIIRFSILAHDGAISEVLFDTAGSTFYTSASAILLNDSARIEAFAQDRDLRSLSQDRENVSSWDVLSGNRLNTFVTPQAIAHAGARISLSPNDKVLFVVKGMTSPREGATYKLWAFDARRGIILSERDVSELLPVSVVASSEDVVYLIGQRAVYQYHFKSKER